MLITNRERKCQMKEEKKSQRVCMQLVLDVHKELLLWLAWRFASIKNLPEKGTVDYES